MEIPAYLISYGTDWLNLLLRWLHIITGIAWIGASFYFVWLDNHIRAPKPDSALAKQGVAGELWAVHGGGFYNPQKYLLAPPELPQELHWFKWEAYSTWLSGFALLGVVYYFQPEVMLIAPNASGLAPLLSGTQAVLLGLASLAVAWIVYDLLCRSPLGKQPLALGLVVYVLLVASAYFLSQYFSGRATYIHVGAMIGSIMVGNVFFVIIPGQRKLVAALSARQAPDPRYGLNAKQRSVHNNYFTLPVLLIMVSNHYAMTYNHPRSYLVLAMLMAAGVLIRHYFNLRHQGRNAWHYPLAGCTLLLILAVMLAPSAPKVSTATTRGVENKADNTAKLEAQVQSIITRHCTACHSAQPSFTGFAAAPAGVMLDTPAQLKQHAARIHQQVVQNRAMPLGNLTKMTDAERQLIANWFQAQTNK
jgi:uncharacterized membrane protein